jgi:nucleoside phosphorylase
VGHKVLLTLLGVSMVNAAMTTQALIDHCRVERIIFSGIAGGVNPGLNIGDVVIPAQWSEYQENLFARETAPGVFTPPVWFPVTLSNYGMMFPEAVDICTVNGVPFIIFRSLSDLAGGGPGENEVGVFVQLAANNSAKVMMAFLEALRTK